ncbi:hypothetical protein JTB14_016152 [Gonioctena quinquepunctata]|nr:hypothetical protein JTB14_016152 [Gonioctena quinquepunctata]
MYSYGKSGTFAPVIEKPNPTEFITRHPSDITLSGDYNDVPLMIGFCNTEGMLFELPQMLCIQSYNLVHGKKFDIEFFIPPVMKIEKGSPKSEVISKKLTELYFQGKYANNKYLLPSDYHFIPGIIAAAKIHARTSRYPVYLYRMSLVAGLNFLKVRSKLEDIPGVCHADDLGYLFEMSSLPHYGKDTLEGISVERFVAMWTNFAKYGNQHQMDLKYSGNQ